MQLHFSMVLTSQSGGAMELRTRFGVNKQNIPTWSPNSYTSENGYKMVQSYHESYLSFGSGHVRFPKIQTGGFRYRRDI